MEIRCDSCNKKFNIKRTKPRRKHSFCSKKHFYKWKIDNRKSRFWLKVKRASKNRCWIWIGGKNTKGYGVFLGHGAHRFSYSIHNRIKIKMNVLHKCSNPPCVNPSHLYLGTQKDNAIDRDNSNRTAIGERNGRSKLNEESVRRIRFLYEIGFNREKIAEMFNISLNSMTYCAKRRFWKHVK